MSEEKRSSFSIIGRLTLLLFISVSTLTLYAGFMLKFSSATGDPVGRALQRALPETAEFKPVITETGETLYYEAYDEKGSLVGFGFVKTGRGMWGDIQIAGGIDLDYKLTGLVVLEQGETPGLGARIVESRFLNQFIGLSTGQIKLKKFNGNIDAISGASISSKAVTDIVRVEVERVIKLRETSDGNSST